MTFASFASAEHYMLWATFVIALLMGAVVNKTNFCTMGAVSDWVNMGDTGRMRAWLFAIAIAVLGVVVLESAGIVNASSAFPPYRGSNFIWLENLLGGAMFGMGMTLASGCGNKTLVRIGGGNLKSLLVLVVIAIIAYFMVNPFPGSDKTLYSTLFYSWMQPMQVSLSGPQDLGRVIAGTGHALGARLVIGVILAAALLWFAFKSSDFRSNRDNILGGLVVGLAVLAAWYVTSNIKIGDDGYSLSSFASQWDFLSDSPAGKPAQLSALNPQSFTFINPMGQTLGFVAKGFSATYLTFGVMALFGVIVDSFLWSIITRGFRIEWFASGKDFWTHMVGAVFMGFGGVLGMGCTIGQGITGISTLAMGSFLTFFGIIFGSAMTMKVQYYKMVYEDASFGQAFITGLVDLKLLPSSMRKLEAT